MVREKANFVVGRKVDRRTREGGHVHSLMLDACRDWYQTTPDQSLPVFRFSHRSQVRPPNLLSSVMSRELKEAVPIYLVFEGATVRLLFRANQLPLALWMI